jgi:hypothetical protein
MDGTIFIVNRYFHVAEKEIKKSRLFLIFFFYFYFLLFLFYTISVSAIYRSSLANSMEMSLNPMYRRPNSAS